jgi:glycerol-3-phosphate acyltransferase PlsY
VGLLDGRTALLWVAAYLIGGIPFGYLIARVRGIDIRTVGSGNIGATTVGRALGRRWGVLVFLLDAGKCYGVMNLALTQLPESWPEHPHAAGAWVLAVTGWLAILGSVAPVYLGFRGGKAVSAAVGTLLSVWPDLGIPALGCLILWALVVRLTRYV